MISFEQAQDNLHRLCQTWLATYSDVSEPLALSKSLGRYLTENVVAALELPRSDVSAMDGYAVCLHDRDGALTSQVFTLKGESRAGEPYCGDLLAPGECVRIFTGSCGASIRRIPWSSRKTSSARLNLLGMLHDTVAWREYPPSW